MIAEQKNRTRDFVQRQRGGDHNVWVVDLRSAGVPRVQCSAKVQDCKEIMVIG